MSPVNILNIALSDGIFEINDKFNLKLEKRLDTVFSVSFSLILIFYLIVGFFLSQLTKQLMLSLRFDSADEDLSSVITPNKLPTPGSRRTPRRINREVKYTKFPLFL